MNNITRRNFLFTLAAPVVYPLVSGTSFAKLITSQDAVSLSNTQQTQLEDLKKIVNFPLTPQLQQPEVPKAYKKQIKEALKAFGEKTDKTIDSLLKTDKGYAAFYDPAQLDPNYKGLLKPNMAILNQGNTILIWTQPGGAVEQSFDGKGFIALLEKKKDGQITLSSTTNLPSRNENRQLTAAYLQKNKKLDAPGIVGLLLQKLKAGQPSPLLPKQFDAVKALLADFDKQSNTLAQFDVVYYPNPKNPQSVSLPQIAIDTALNKEGQRIVTIKYWLPEADEKQFKGEQVVLTYPKAEAGQKPKKDEPIGPLKVETIQY